MSRPNPIYVEPNLGSAKRPAGRLRADARRNRDQVIAAAKAVFAESGVDVPMEMIARRAGVGVGTLYRRFPDRGELIAAVAAQTFTGVISDIAQAVEAEANAWNALVRLVTGSENLRLTVHLGFPSPHSWKAVHVASESRGLHARLMATLEQLVCDAQAEGAVRSDIGPGDALNLVSIVLGTRPPDSDPVGQEWSARSLRLVLDGLRATHSSPLPGAKVTVEDLNSRIEHYGEDDGS